MQIQIRLTKEQSKALSGNNSTLKGNTVEYIVSEVLYRLGAEEVYRYQDLNNQINRGDFRIKVADKIIQAEVKTSHNWQNKDKQAMDIFYFNYSRKYGLLPYYQGKSTGNYQGWLYLTQADWLICFNPISHKMYIIKEYQKLKEQIIKDTEEYINKLPKCERTWYRRGHKNQINKYLEGSVKEDSCKESLIVNLELSPESFNYFNVKYDIIEITLITDRRIRSRQNKNHSQSPNKEWFKP